MRPEIALRTAQVLHEAWRPWAAADWVVEAAEGTQDPDERSSLFLLAASYFVEARQFALAAQATTRSARIWNRASEWTTAAHYYALAGDTQSEESCRGQGRARA